jgi:hypothetical protein
MGGINSGRRPTTNVGTVEATPFLDIRSLRRLGLIHPGECTCDTLRWSNGAGIVAEARVSVDLSDVGSATIRIAAVIVATPLKQCIAIEAIDCHFGGHRFYFLCPLEGHRCEVLYFVNGTFASRKAHRLSYTVQRMGELSRVRHRRRKLDDRLDGRGLLPRPRGRHRYALVQRLRKTKKQERRLFADGLRRIVEQEAQKDERLKPDSH